MIDLLISFIILLSYHLMNAELETLNRQIFSFLFFFITVISSCKTTMHYLSILFAAEIIEKKE